MIDILKHERRYFVFDKNSYAHLIKECKFLSTYNLEKGADSQVTDVYYDNDKGLLLENELLLRRRVNGKKAILKLKRRFYNKQFFYSDTLRSHEREKEINARDPLSEHYFFLNNALNSMFTTTLKFDPDKLFASVKPTLVLRIKQSNHIVFGFGGFKAEILDQRIAIKNYKTKRNANTEIIQIKCLSGEGTLPLYDEFIKRVEKHCKEIFYTKDSRFEIGQRLTKPLPSKEERKKARMEALKLKAIEESGEQINPNI